MTRSPARTLSSEVISTGTYTQPGGGGLGALRSKPTTSAKRPANRRITASPIRPLEPVTMMIPLSDGMDGPFFLASGGSGLGPATPDTVEKAQPKPLG